MTPPTPFAQSVAVVIGIDRYSGGIPALRTAVNDARRMGELLHEAHGYTVTALLDGEATQANIATLLKTTLPATIGPDDRVLFYFAGHGVARDGDTGPAGYLLPFDATRGDERTYLDMPLVHDALLALDCRHMLIILDSCFSGAFRWSGTRSFVDDVSVVHQEKYDRYVRDPAWQVITSAAEDQRALDQLSAGALGSRDRDGAHSPFALALFRGIAGDGDVIPNGIGDGLVTATELFLFLDNELQDAAIAAGTAQTPGLWPLRKHGKGEFVFFVPGKALTLPPAPVLDESTNPWRGLASYDEASAALFFGRDAEVAALAARIAQSALTVVLGASGTGKSSLVKAGAIPALKARALLVLPVLRPGTSPLAALAQAVTPPQASPIAATPDAIRSAVSALVGADPARGVVLVIDQFEELITLVRSSEERDATLALLASLANAHADALHIVLTLRSDFEPNFDRSQFGDRWKAGRFVVPPMSRDALRAVIEKPANASVLYFDPPALVDTLLDDVVATPGGLPLLSFALSEMYLHWLRREKDDRAIARIDYDALGGVIGALRARAESEYEALGQRGAAYQATLRRVMLRLVTTDGGALARRRANAADLAFADTGEAARAATVTQRLIAARLLVGGRDPDGAEFVEPAHDALVRGWGRLVQWVREENEAPFPLSQQQRMARAALEWERADKPSKSGLLWSDTSRASQLAPLVKTLAPWLTARELAFAKRSLLGRRIARFTAIGATLLILGSLGMVFLSQRADAARAQKLRVAAIVRTASQFVSSKPLIAAQLVGSLDAVDLSHADDATQLALLGAALAVTAAPRVLSTFGTDAESGAPGIGGASVSSDGTHIVFYTDSAVSIWRADGTGVPVVLRFGKQRPRRAAFAPDGARVAVVCDDNVVCIFRSDGSGTPLTIRTDSNTIDEFEFSRDGSRILATFFTGPARIWTADGRGNGTEIGTGSSIVEAHFVDGDRQVVVRTDAGEAQIWSAAGGAPTRTLKTPTSISAMRVSPDGTRIALGTESGLIQVVDVTAPAPGDRRPRLLRITGHVCHGDSICVIESLSWSSDGTRLVSVSLDETVRIWDGQSGRELTRVGRPGEAIHQAELCADGSRLLTTSKLTYEPLVWNLDGSGTRVVLRGQIDELVAAFFVPKSTRVISASADGSLLLWELPSPPLYHGAAPTDTAGLYRATLTAAAFSRDASRLAVGALNGQVAVYWSDSVSKPAQIRSITGSVRALTFSRDISRLGALPRLGSPESWQLSSAVPPVAVTKEDGAAGRAANSIMEAHLSDDGRRAVALTVGNEVRSLTMTGSAPPVVLNHSIQTLTCSAISHDGTLVAFCDDHRWVQVVHADGSPPARVFKRSESATAVAFTHDGQQVVVGYGDGSTIISPLNTTGGSAAPRRLTGHTKSIRHIDVGPGDTLFLTASEDGTVRIREVATGNARATLRSSELDFSDARFTGDGRHVVTVGAHESEARLWNSDGSGESILLPGGNAAVQWVVASPDGRRVLAVTDQATARLLPIDLDLALRPLHTGPACLSIDQRQRYLLENATEATAGLTKCRNETVKTGRTK